MIMELFWNYSDTIFPFIVFILLLIFGKGVHGFALFSFYLFITFMLMGYTNYLADRGVNNMIFYHLYSLIEVILLLPLITLSRKKRLYPALWGIVPYLVFWIINITIWE